METLEFYGNVVVKFKLQTLTGLHIGGNKDTFEIGGIDNPVIKVPENIKPFEINSAFNDSPIRVEPGIPYIPGSSLKGKLRSLLEWKYGDIDPSGDVNKGKEDFDKNGNILAIRKLFGISPTVDKLEKAIEKGLFPVRIRVFDSYPLIDPENFETELKYENSINRITSKANPRPFERVPAGTEFEGTIIIRIFQKEDWELLQKLAEAFSMLEDDYLGGGGSRGSGRVELTKVKVLFKDTDFYSSKSDPTLLHQGEGTKALYRAAEELKKLLNGRN